MIGSRMSRADQQRLRWWQQKETESRVAEDDPEFAGRPILVTVGFGTITFRARGARKRFTVPLAHMFEFARRYAETPLFAKGS